MMLDAYLTPSAAASWLFLILIVTVIGAIAWGCYKVWLSSTLLYWIPFKENTPRDGRVTRVLAEYKGKYIVFTARVKHTPTAKGPGLFFEQVDSPVPLFDRLHSWSVEL